MQQRKLILFIIALFLLSSAYLLYVGSKYNNLNFGSDYWIVYFSDPKSNDLDFIIENHSDKTDFHWEILTDKDKIKEGNAKIEKGVQSKLSELSSDENLVNKKITVEVITGGEKKEIYKNL